MINGREPNYICFDTMALKMSRRLSDSERLSFYDGLMNAYQDKLEGKSSDFPDSMIGDLLMQAAETMSKYFDLYMKKASGNKPEKTSGVPVVDQCITSGVPVVDQCTESDQYHNDIYNDNFNQIKTRLIADGFTKAEIDFAINKCNGRRVRNLDGYIRKIIEEERRTKPGTINAQNYEQRDYSGVQDELIAEQDREMEEFMKKEAAARECEA